MTSCEENDKVECDAVFCFLELLKCYHSQYSKSISAVYAALPDSTQLPLFQYTMTHENKFDDASSFLFFTSPPFSRGRADFSDYNRLTRAEKHIEKKRHYKKIDNDYVSFLFHTS